MKEEMTICDLCGDSVNENDPHPVTDGMPILCDGCERFNRQKSYSDARVKDTPCDCCSTGSCK